MPRHGRKLRRWEKHDAPDRRSRVFIGITVLVGTWLLGLALQTVVQSHRVPSYLFLSLVSLVVALIPFAVAHRREHRSLGNRAFLVTACVAFLLGPVLAAPVSLCFLIVALVRPQPEPPPGAEIVRVFGSDGKSRPDDLDEVGRRLAAGGPADDVAPPDDAAPQNA